MEKFFPPVSEQERQIPGQAVSAFMNRLRSQGVNMHGFCMVHKGRMVAEHYYAPITRDYQHRMYSVGKSFTSIGIGLLQEDGLITLDDSVAEHFPEACPQEMHPYTKMMTVRDLLEMRTAHPGTTYRGYDGRWVDSFFTVKPDHVPGTVFSYDTSATHVLSALIEKKTGMELMEYLKARAFDALELSAQCHFLKDPYGVSQGGSGLLCTMGDLAKVGWLLANEGVWQGRQLLPRAYVRQATARQVATSFLPMAEERHGYGWQIWQVREGGFALYGMGGQLCICLPQHQFMLTTMADTLSCTTGIHDIHCALWDILYPHLEGVTQIAQRGETDQAQVLSVPGEHRSAWTKIVSGQRYTMEENAMGLTSFCLDLADDGGQIRVASQAGEDVFTFGLGHVRQGMDHGDPYLASGAWIDGNTFCVRVNRIPQDLSETVIIAGFRGEYVTVSLRQYGEPASRYPQGFASGRRG